MSRSSNRRTWIVRITSELSYGALATGLETLGDVEHMQLKDGSIVGTNGALPAKGNMDGTKKSYRWTDAGRASFTQFMRDDTKKRHDQAVDTLVEIIRVNAHAPMFKLVNLMNRTLSRPSRNSKMLWSEKTLEPYVEEALEILTAPEPGPRPEG